MFSGLSIRFQIGQADLRPQPLRMRDDISTSSSSSVLDENPTPRIRALENHVLQIARKCKQCPSPLWLAQPRR